MAALTDRLVAGALSGFVATAPMTAVMHQMHGRLKKKQRYPLPPGEIVGATLPGLDEEAATNATLIAHFAYGAVSGAALAALIPKPTMKAGAMGGVGIWLASYLGWIPTAGILKPATRHPASRNMLMLLAHLIWGTAFALTQRNLLNSRPTFRDGHLQDAG